MLHLDKNAAASSEKGEPLLESAKGVAQLGYLPLNQVSALEEKLLWEIHWHVQRWKQNLYP